MTTDFSSCFTSVYSHPRRPATVRIKRRSDWACCARKRNKKKTWKHGLVLEQPFASFHSFFLFPFMFFDTRARAQPRDHQMSAFRTAAVRKIEKLVKNHRKNKHWRQLCVPNERQHKHVWFHVRCSFSFSFQLPLLLLMLTYIQKKKNSRCVRVHFIHQVALYWHNK